MISTDSLWTKSQPMPQFPALSQDIQTDVLIIGGGLCGILCAHFLKKAQVDCVLAEAQTLCSGATQNTTAKITSQHGLIYAKLLKRWGEEGAGLYLRAQEEALERYRTLCAQIPCDFEEKDAFVYTRDSRKELEQELLALKALGYPAQLTQDLPLPIPTAGAVRFPRQAQFHPLQFAAAISQGLPIYEHTRVTQLRPGEAVTEGGVIRAKRIITATHFPFLNKHGSYFLKLYQDRSYLLALEGAPLPPGMYLDGEKGGLSFRSYGKRLLLGGGGHRTGKKGGGWDQLTEFARRHYPRAREVGRWAAQDCMSLDGIPYIGPYSNGTLGLWVASGFNKWGMTSSMAAALLLTDQMLGKKSPYQRLFSPSRSILTSQLAANAGHALLGLLTPTAPRCPHMGCALHYNPQEHSWDCGCHGSRFSKKGKLLDGPATGDKKLSKG